MLLSFYCVYIIYSCSVGQEIKSRILVSPKSFNSMSGFVFSAWPLTETLYPFFWIGDKSSRRLCPPVHELHECHFCCPEAGTIINLNYFINQLTSLGFVYFIWNWTFCVLKQNILIDACVLDSESGLLQQVHLSNSLILAQTLSQKILDFCRVNVVYFY